MDQAGAGEASVCEKDKGGRMHPQMSTVGCSTGVAVTQPFASFFLYFLPLGDHFHLSYKHVCFPCSDGESVHFEGEEVDWWL